MATLELSMPYLLENEGGYTDKPVPTNHGIEPIDLANYLREPVSTITAEDIKTLSMSTVNAIYREQFWNKMNLNLVDDQRVATCIFDTGVQRGKDIAAMYAQKICIAYGHPIVLDGYLGPRTAIAINSLTRSAFIRFFAQLEWAGYEAILSAHPDDEIYRRGWEARAKKLLTLI